MELSIKARFKLNNDVEMPVLGLGVWQIPQGQTRRAVKHAFDVGYRLIDTAALYGNEHEVGEALNASRLLREEAFITTKLWNTDHGYENALKALDKSLARLGLKSVDLYLIHWPEGDRRIETWKALEKMLSEGKASAIGVSNFTIGHLEELISSSDVVPAVNQVEFHPYLFQEELLDFCQKNRIQLEAYSPLGHGRLLGDPNLRVIAERYNKTVAQVIIRWGLQHEVVMIPKSSKRERITENAEVFDFELAPKDMISIDSLGNSLRTVWDPTNIP